MTTYVLLAVFACLCIGLLRMRARIATGVAPLPNRFKFNGEALLKRGLLQSRLFITPAITGYAHALMFLGALIEIFAHVQYELLLAGRIDIDSSIGLLFLAYGRQIAALMMLAGLLYMLWRRISPPERLTAGKSRNSFIVMEVLLLLAVILGLLGSQVSFGDFDWWWLHAAPALAFVALIGFSPMSHIVLGPINSALAPQRSGITLPPIDFEAEPPKGEKLRVGAAKLADLSWKNLLDLSACLWCGRCHDACPAAQTGKPLSPKKIMLTCAEFQQQGRLQDTSLIDALGKEAIFNCTSCGACIEKCPVSNNPAEVILEFRRNFVMDRSEIPETMVAPLKNLGKRGHPFASTESQLADWRQDLEVPMFVAGETEYLFWLGCSVVYDLQAQKVARAMVRLLDAAGVSYGILDGQRCTGDPAKMMGDELLFVDMAQANIEEFRDLQVGKVITVCAHCFNSFDRYYPQLGGNWETIPHAVFIDRLVSEGKLKPKASQQTITFHDPCYLGRHNDIYDPGRNVVSSLGQLVEMPRNRQDSFCCGGGGGNYWGGQGGTARISDVRFEEALATGADRIATSCPFCLLMLDASASKNSEERKVFDIAELMVEALDNQEPAKQ